ncbi:MAG: pyrroline-5-carboxylate reductase [Bacteroidota bacterium]
MKSNKSKKDTKEIIAILGAGNIGRSIAEGLPKTGKYKPGQIILTQKKVHSLENLRSQGFIVQSDNRDAVRKAKIIIITVRPLQLNGLLEEIRSDLDPENHILVSVVTDVTIGQIYKQIDPKIQVVRAMPNLAISISESMTCLATIKESQSSIDKVKNIFDALGKTLIIEENLMVSATVLCACGVAFFLRAIRAASQGGIQIGFHAEVALQMAAQTAKGAAEILLKLNKYPESEIDKVTTPRGCTIAGLNEMEHQGFSSSMIKGIITSYEQAEKLYKGEN